MNRPHPKASGRFLSSYYCSPIGGYKLLGGIFIKNANRLLAVFLAFMMLAVPIGVLASSSENCNTDMALGADGSQSDPYKMVMLTGDTYQYTLSANINVNYSITSGNLNNIGFSLSNGVISGTAAEGKEKIAITAAANDGGPSRSTVQWINYEIYNVLTLTGQPSATSWANQEYATTLTISDVDPDAVGETTLTLNQAAIDAGYTLTTSSDHNGGSPRAVDENLTYYLKRTADKNVAGSVDVTVTASTGTGGIEQQKTISTTIATYGDVGITSTPPASHGTGNVIWTIEGEASYTYRPAATPSGAVITVSGTTDAITYADGVLTVNTAAAFDTKQVIITATSNAGGSAKTATQELSIRNWVRVVFESSPSVSDITATVDGRTVNVQLKAQNYSLLTLDMGDGTIYEDTTEVSHTYENPGKYLVRATATDETGRQNTSATTVTVSSNEGDPTPAPGGDEANKFDYGQFFKDNWGAIVALVLGIFILLYGVYDDYNEIALAVGVVLIAIAAIVLYADYSSTDVIQEIKDWFSGIGGSKDAA